MPNTLPPYEFLQQCTNVSRETFEKLEAFKALLEKWNNKINLVSKSSVDLLWQRHIIDSAQLMRYIPATARTVTDFGSGAGFPGIILSLLGVPEVHLVESDGRKAVFLAEASRLSSGVIHIHDERIEALTPWKTDIITARALAPLPWLLKLSYPFFNGATTALFLKGAHAKDELETARLHWDVNAILHPSITDNDAWIIQLNQVIRRG